MKDKSDAEFLKTLAGDYDGRSAHPIGDRLREIAGRMLPIPVSERLPSIAERVLALASRWYIAARICALDDQPVWEKGPDEPVTGVTHWLPLPPNPE